MELLKDLYIYPWTNVSINNCNTYIIGKDQPILIDPGLEFCLESVQKHIKKDGINPESIKLVITTHSHPDHFDGVKWFMKKDTKIAFHPDEDAFIREFGRNFYNMFGLRLPEYRVDFYVQEGDFTCDGTQLTIFHTPGHSPGSISIYWPEHKVLIAGDVIFEAGVGRTDFPGGDGKLLRKSIERLAQLDVDYLLPGHGGVVKGKHRVKRNFEYVADVYYSLI